MATTTKLLTDEATATPVANKVPKTGASGRLAIGLIASGTPDGTKFVRDDGVLAVPAGSGGSVTVREADGSPTVAATAIEFDQAQGFTVTNPSAGVARVTLPTAAAGVKGVVPLSADGGTTAGQAVQATDARLSNTRNPNAHQHGASDIISGTLATARLGSGTANSTTYLRGDQTWATVSGGSAPGLSGVALRRSANLTLVLNTDTVIDWDTEDSDTDSYHAAGNPSRITFGTAGIYLITFLFEFSTSSSGDRMGWVRLNGVDIIGGATVKPVSSVPTRGSITLIHSASVSDYVEGFVRSSIAIDVNAVKATCFAARRMA